MRIPSAALFLAARARGGGGRCAAEGASGRLFRRWL